MLKKSAPQTLMNICRSAMNPAKAVVMAQKTLRRFMDPQGTISPADYQAWLKRSAVDIDSFLSRFDPALVAEANEFSRNLDIRANDILSRIPHDLGGGGGVPLLYILTRLRRPSAILETGVAAGFSSATFLAALERNGTGHLYSSDFPYFRIENPEQYVGVVVDPALKSRWSLFLKGDDSNIPDILSRAGTIDLFHYDSDKSYTGRTKTMNRVRPHMSEGALVVMDDIQDNAYFHDLVKPLPTGSFHVIFYQGKYIGLIGNV